LLLLIWLFTTAKPISIAALENVDGSESRRFVDVLAVLVSNRRSALVVSLP
jgi:hypothetical protein